MTTRLITTCLFVAAFAGCGGGGDFSGDPTVPDGYKTYSKRLVITPKTETNSGSATYLEL